MNKKTIMEKTKLSPFSLSGPPPPLHTSLSDTTAARVTSVVKLEYRVVSFQSFICGMTMAKRRANWG